MWSIGFISKIEHPFFFITVNRYYKNIPFKLISDEEYSVNEIIGLNIIDSEEKLDRIRMGVTKPDFSINSICHFNDIDMTYFYSLNGSTYEDSAIIAIAKNDFREYWTFKKFTQHTDISTYLINLFYQEIIKAFPDFEKLTWDYVNSVSISKLIDERETSYEEKITIYPAYEDERTGNFYPEQRIREPIYHCTKYTDQYLQSLLHIRYTPPYCNRDLRFYQIDFIPGQHESVWLDEAVKKSAKDAIKNYSKEEHFRIVKHDFDVLLYQYEDAKKKALDVMKRQLGYPSTS